MLYAVKNILLNKINVNERNEVIDFNFTMKQPLIDLQLQYQSIKPEVDNAIQKVLNRSDFILGKEVKEFEEAISRYLGVRYAVGVASGTDALKIALQALDIGPGDEVITTPFTFIATGESIHQAGAKPVFADIDPKTLNICPQEIKKKISSKTKAVIPVHLYGQPAEMDEIISLTRDKKIFIIEDCAQAMGAVYKGKKAGAIGTVGCFSFFPGKNLGCYGDGGLLTTNDENVAERARKIRNHGSKSKYEHIMPGYNSRLDTIQAAMLLVKLKRLDEWNEQRRRHAQAYREGLAPLGFSFPEGNSHSMPSMNYFTFIVEKERDALRQYLTEQEIASGIYYPISLHLQKVFDFLGYKKGDFPVSEDLQDRILSLPMYPELVSSQVQHIIEVIGYKNKL